MKRCSCCGETKTGDQFGQRRRSPDGLQPWCKSCVNADRRARYTRNPETERERCAAYMARARRDPSRVETIRASQRKAYANGGAQKQRERINRMQAEQPFRWRAQLLVRKLGWQITEADLRELWDAQQGLCALTGRPLDIRTAELDHIVPRSRGGSNGLGNLRWLTREANQAKGDMLDEEFLALCAQVAEHVGRLIMAADRREVT